MANYSARVPWASRPLRRALSPARRLSSSSESSRIGRANSLETGRYDKEARDEVDSGPARFAPYLLSLRSINSIRAAGRPFWHCRMAESGTWRQLAKLPLDLSARERARRPQFGRPRRERTNSPNYLLAGELALIEQSPARHLDAGSEHLSNGR